MKNNNYPFINSPLPYAYDALEPFIDEKTMHLHHDKHLQTYIDNLNAILKDNPHLQKQSLEQLIHNSSRMPKRLQTPVRNNAGGVYNHRFFFSGLTLSGGGTPCGALSNAITKQFGNFDSLKTEFKKAALSVFGSGYTWLICSRNNLKLVTTPNQNSPIEQGCCAILTLDVWEHAYYLNHYNLRTHYIDDWFNVIDWEQANQNYMNYLFSVHAS